MTRQEFINIMVEERNLDLEENAIYLDDFVDHPFALGVYQENESWIVYYQDDSDMAEEVTCDTEEKAFEVLMEFIQTREIEAGFKME